jgi:hypothetical protein
MNDDDRDETSQAHGCPCFLAAAINATRTSPRICSPALQHPLSDGAARNALAFLRAFALPLRFVAPTPPATDESFFPRLFIFALPMLVSARFFVSTLL